MATKTKTAKAAFARVVREVEKIKNDEPATLEVVDPGDAIRQGDIYLVRLGDRLPDKADEWAGRQVAIGNTQGSRHVVVGDAELYRPDEDSAAECLAGLVPEAADYEHFFGPVISARSPWTLAHPEHGDRTVPSGNYIITQQRAFAQELRRAAD